MGSRILVIDDDVAVRKSFTLALEDTDYQVDTAESGMKGIEMVEKGKYALIYLDLKMPNLNGVETLCKLREIDTNVPVYIVTAFHNEFFSQLQGAVNNGIEFEVLQKPIGSDKILLVTQSVLGEPIEY